MLEQFVIFTIISFALLILISLISYLPRVRAWFYAFRKQEHLVNDKKNRIAVIVPARNESKVIGDLFTSAKEQTYDHDYFDLHIIVKEESDPTIKMAEDAGFIVHIIPNQKCKGDALDATLQDILAKTPDYYDQFLVVDADCVMDPHMLEEFNNAVASGRDVIQCKKLVKNYFFGDHKKCNTWATCNNGLIWPLMDDMGNKYKSEKNIVAFTVGTGIMFSARVIKEIGGWPYRQTLTEDVEFGLDSVLQGYTCYYTEYAKIYVEEATSMDMTNKRRSRWMSGVVDSYRIYGNAIRYQTASSYTKENRRNYYYGLNLKRIYIYIAGLIGLSLFSFISTIVLGILGRSLWFTTLMVGIGSLLAIYLSFGFMGLICVLVDWKNIKLNFFQKIWLIITHPFFYMGYIPIVAKSILSHKNKGWEVIERVDFAPKKEVAK